MVAVDVVVVVAAAGAVVVVMLVNGVSDWRVRGGVVVIMTIKSRLMIYETQTKHYERKGS